MMGSLEKQTHRLFLTTQEVAHMLGISDDQLRNQLPRLQADEGFPLQMPQQKRPKLFRRDAVERWLERASNMTLADIEEAECLGLTVGNVHAMVQARRSA